MFAHFYRSILPVLMLAICLTSDAFAGENCCSHCGCECECKTVCRLVKEERKVDVTCWGCKCEDFCVNGPSKPGCQYCEDICGPEQAGDGKAVVCAKPKRFVWTDWIPGCAEVHTRKKLMKKTVAKKLPGYKWVVEDVCSQCDEKLVGAEIEPGADVPLPPVADVKLKFRRALEVSDRAAHLRAPVTGVSFRNVPAH